MLITRKWCEIWQKFVLTTTSKPWEGFPNPLLLWLSRQWGWAKRYTATSKAFPNFLREEFRISKFSKLSGVTFRLVPPYGGLLVLKSYKKSTRNTEIKSNMPVDF